MTDHIIHSKDGQTYDLHNNRIAFGLLPKDVQDAMKAWPHGIEMYSFDGVWLEVDDPSWHNTFVYCAIVAPKGTKYVLYWREGYDATPYLAGDDTHRILIRDDGKGNLTATVEKL
jgi:hypothetical protein